MLVLHHHSHFLIAEWIGSKPLVEDSLTTCGLSHVGGPEADEYGERGLHGGVSNLPAEIESIIQPDPIRGQMEMSITGTNQTNQVFGPSLELRRTISGTLGKATIRIHDEVMNLCKHTRAASCFYIISILDGPWWMKEQIFLERILAIHEGDRENKIFREGNNFQQMSTATG